MTDTTTTETAILAGGCFWGAQELLRHRPGVLSTRVGYSGDDINKFLWMVRIAEGVWPDEVNERSFFTSRGEYRVDDQATPTMKNSLM